MKNRAHQPVASLALCGFLAITIGVNPASSQSPFVDFSRAQSGSIGVAGFPALEVFPQENGSIATIVARELPLQGNITYSSGYFSPTKKFSPPQFFSFTLYGYHSQPEWKEIKVVNFKFGNQVYGDKPHYSVQGPDRDRTLDTQTSEYLETMVVLLPPNIARQIADNNGVAVTTDPATFYLPIPASKLDRFKQLVNSVAAISKSQKIRSQQTLKAKPSRGKITPPGLPITEVFEDASGSTTLETELAPISDRFGIQGMAYTAYQGRKLKQPYMALLVLSRSPYQLWSNVNSVTLSFGAKRLRLTPNARNSHQSQDGMSIEALTVRVPYKDFVTLARSSKFYVTVGNASYEISSWQASGIRELVKRTSK